ncbi:Phosphatidylinositol-4-phosphate 5-kinase, core [Sesbania bispinosa]|nr:Phosphatidylinositol-4-phosphate 5-kinase, core [Sesbania bispinosa]
MEDCGRLHEKIFPNGDVYIGKIKGTLPHEKGKYTWSDGTVYEGDWEGDKMTGKGLIVWSSGAFQYEGEFSGGYLNGYGTLRTSSGCIYRGGWRMNAQHGIGRKEYSNSDIYEGLWKEGVPEGSGRYTWNNGNVYIGNWKSGKIDGRGVMKWANGDTFDGFWLNGHMHGSGVYRFGDGSVYIGTWNKGLKDGKGIFYPTGSKHPSLKKFHSPLNSDDHGFLLNTEEKLVAPKSRVKRSLSENIPVIGRFKSFRQISNRTLSLDTNWSTRDPAQDCICNDSSLTLHHAFDEDQPEASGKSTLVYEREYIQGVLIMERISECSESSHKNKQHNKFSVKQVKKSSCVDIFGGQRSYYLKLNLQLGIRYTVGKITPVPAREVRSSDFGDRARIRMYFPRDGSKLTPPHCSINFYWKDYRPMVFRNLREMFKLDAAEYMMSICGDSGLRDLSSPGKSGSIFYLSKDDRFVIKTLTKSELKVLLNMLPKYYRYVGDHENTLITKFFGLHRITLRGGQKVRFVVMGNMFCTELHIHRRYDLKGSSQGRYTDNDKIDGNTTLKDLDLKYEFHMDKKLRESLLKQISLDCKFLESQQIIDYSLLLGLHFRAPENLKALAAHHGSMQHQETSPSGDGELLILPKGLVLVAHEPSVVNTAPGPHIRGNTLRAYSMGDNEVDLLLPGTARLRVQLGVNMPAQATRKLQEEATELELFEVYDVVLYMGIIDILQEYNVRKKIEHAYKSLQFDPLTISVVEPKMYAERFIKFSENKVFPNTP